MEYDARIEIYEHIAKVRGLLLRVVGDLLFRADTHDISKFTPLEVEEYYEYTPTLETMPYGSEEEREARAAIVDAGARQHYLVNRHHPEHFEDGIHGMNLLDLIEMLCDWKVASEFTGYGPYEGTRTPPGLEASIEVNAERFGFGDELRRILLNTARVL